MTRSRMEGGPVVDKPDPDQKRGQQPSQQAAISQSERLGPLSDSDYAEIGRGYGLSEEESQILRLYL